jgi:hypothetical protein
MSDLKRLIEEGSNDFEARLLKAGLKDGPSTSGRRRVLAGLGLMGAASTGTATAAAKIAGVGGAAKLIGGGAVAALAIWGGIELGHRGENGTTVSERSAAQQARPAERVAGAERERNASPAEPLAAAAQAEPITTKPSELARPAPAGAPARAQDSLAAELAGLELARAALLRKDPALALRLLDDHARRFPKQRLAVEATVVRIEALSKSGDSARAARLGNDFLARHPNAPHAARVRSLIGDARLTTKTAP